MNQLMLDVAALEQLPEVDSTGPPDYYCDPASCAASCLLSVTTR
ncbi:hypothetical protein [Actinopolymorpha alba]|nr:hypothetical protein [Actinopolymorpha alba]